MSEPVSSRRPECETCEDDGYVDIVDDWGGVLGPAPCPNCSPLDPLEAVDAALSEPEEPRQVEQP